MGGRSAAPGHTDVVSTSCRPFGSKVPFTPERIAALYENHGTFVSACTQATKKLVKEGFILRPTRRSSRSLR
jgi:hypothetical protein